MIKTIKISLFTLVALVSNNGLANDFSPDFIKNEIQMAHTQYLKGSSESGLYALHALTRILESTESSDKLDPNNLSFTYLRIGLLHEKMGRASKANEFFNKAMKNYIGSNANIAQLKEVALLLDENAANTYEP
ncbi:hypothetical protein [Thalassotalea fusca]